MQSLRMLGVAALLGTFTSVLNAQGWIDPVRPVPQNPTGPVERLRSAVQVSISGRVARVTVEEWFRNNGPTLGEGMYHFPLPGEGHARVKRAVLQIWRHQRYIIAAGPSA